MKFFAINCYDLEAFQIVLFTFLVLSGDIFIKEKPLKSFKGCQNESEKLKEPLICIS